MTDDNQDLNLTANREHAAQQRVLAAAQAAKAFLAERPQRTALPEVGGFVYFLVPSSEEGTDGLWFAPALTTGEMSIDVGNVGAIDSLSDVRAFYLDEQELLVIADELQRAVEQADTTLLSEAEWQGVLQSLGYSADPGDDLEM